jgi:pyrimidine-specific ribonucleoside hydrolase
MAKRIWFDTDIMIGLPERAPREVDDGVTLIMALRQPAVEIVGISLVTEIHYAYDVTQKILGWYNKTGKDIPVYKGSDLCNDIGVETDASLALADALRKEKLSILALGPNTNIATVLVNHPELASQIEEIAFCIGRTEDYTFRPGLGHYPVGDYNYIKDEKSMNIILATEIPLVFSGFECSKDVFLGPIDIDRLDNDFEGDKWVYDQLMPWIKRGTELFGSNGFIPYDVTPLGYFTHPEYFAYYEHIPVQVNVKPNDSLITGRDPRIERPYVEVSYDFKSKRTVKYAYRTLSGFEEIVIKSLLGK